MARNYTAAGSALWFETERQLGLRGFLGLASETGQHTAIFIGPPLRPVRVDVAVRKYPPGSRFDKKHPHGLPRNRIYRQAINLHSMDAVEAGSEEAGDHPNRGTGGISGGSGAGTPGSESRQGNALGPRLGTGSLLATPAGHRQSQLSHRDRRLRHETGPGQPHRPIGEASAGDSRSLPYG